MNKNKTHAIVFKEQLFAEMLSIKSDKGVFINAIDPNGNKIEWYLFSKSIVPEWINASSLLTFRALTREERRMIHKSKIKSNDPSYYKRKPVVSLSKK